MSTIYTKLHLSDSRTLLSAHIRQARNCTFFGPMSFEPSASSALSGTAFDAAMPIASSVASIAAPPSSQMLYDDISTSSPAVSTSTLPSNAPSVSPVASATALIHTAPPMISDAGNAKAKMERIKPQMGMNGGRWTDQEHQSFLAGLRLYGREWKKVASKIKTRTSAQIRSHAQKYFAKLARDDEMRKHNGLAPQLEGAAAQAISSSSLYGYYSDGGSSANMNSGDEGGDTDSSTTQRSSQQSPGSVNAIGKVAFPATSTTSQQPAPSFPAALPASASSNLAILFSSASTQEAAFQTKKRSRAGSAISSALSLQPLTKSVQSQHKHQRRNMTREAGGAELLPSQEELLEKVSPNIRQRLSSLIEAELCALQVLSCSALLQRQDVSRQTQVASHSSLMGHAVSLPGPVSAGGTPFPGQSSLGLTMIATEQIPSISSIY